MRLLVVVCSLPAFIVVRRTPRELKRSGLKILEELGKGFFGIVFKGMLKEHANVPGYLVAVKSLNDRVWGKREGEVKRGGGRMCSHNPCFLTLSHTHMRACNLHGRHPTQTVRSCWRRRR